MLVLINNDFKALRHGAFVTACEESGEFILNTEDCDLAVATLLEIGNANKISLKKEKKQDVVSKLEAGLLTLKLPEQNQMSDSEKVKEIVLAGFEKELQDDDMLIQIVKAGIPFRKANKMFRSCVEDHGLRISAKKRAEEIEEILEENEFFPETFDEVKAMSERIAIGNSKEGLEKVADTTTQQAMKAIKKFLKAKEIEFPKAPRQPKGGLRARFLGFASLNPTSTDEELSQWFLDNTKNKDDKDAEKWMNRYLPTINHGRAIAQFCLDKDISPAPVTVAEKAEETED